MQVRSGEWDKMMVRAALFQNFDNNKRKMFTASMISKLQPRVSPLTFT